MKADLYQFSSLLTWWWAPSFGSSILLNVLYSSSILNPPSSPRQRNNHLQLARTAVILSTLFYQLYTSITTSQPNYYQLLALPLDVDAEGVKRSFRALARKYHPDKVGEQGEAIFIVLRKAHDALSDPNKRFAYDRFGPSIVDWKDCESARDFMRHGLMGLVAFYTINPALYALFGYVNGNSSGVSFWRLSTLFALFAFELSLLVSPEYPTWLTLLFPNTTIYDLLQLAHGLFVNFFFASLQLCAALDVLEYGENGAPARGKAATAARAEQQMEAVKAKAMVVSQAAEVVKGSVTQSFALGVRPFRGKHGKEMSAEEEKIWERMDEVLLARSLVAQHPGLLALARQGKDDRGHVQVPQESHTKEEAKEEEEVQVPQAVAVKAEPVEDLLNVDFVQIKGEEATSALRQTSPEYGGALTAAMTQRSDAKQEETVDSKAVADNAADVVNQVPLTAPEQEAGRADITEAATEPTPLQSTSTEPWIHLGPASQIPVSEVQTMAASTEVGQKAPDVVVGDVQQSSGATISPAASQIEAQMVAATDVEPASKQTQDVLAASGEKQPESHSTR